jgi:hypothetical protein
MNMALFYHVADLAPSPNTSVDTSSYVLCTQAALAASPVTFAYEAAVCGGIPIVHALQSDFLCDDIMSIRGKYPCVCICYVWSLVSETCHFYLCACISVPRVSVWIVLYCPSSWH